MSSESKRLVPPPVSFDIGVELSLYPLDRDYLPSIRALIERLHSGPQFRVTTNSMSTQIFGPYDELMPFLLRELRPVFDSNGKAVVVMKILGPLADP